MISIIGMSAPTAAWRGGRAPDASLITLRVDIVADLAISHADTRDGDMSFSASPDCAGGGIGGEGAILAGVAADCALGAMSGSDAASSAGSGCCCSGCDPAFWEILGGAGEGERWKPRGPAGRAGVSMSIYEWSDGGGASGRRAGGGGWRTRMGTEDGDGIMVATN